MGRMEGLENKRDCTLKEKALCVQLQINSRHCFVALDGSWLARPARAIHFVNAPREMGPVLLPFLNTEPVVGVDFMQTLFKTTKMTAELPKTP